MQIEVKDSEISQSYSSTPQFQNISQLHKKIMSDLILFTLKYFWLVDADLNFEKIIK